jgi:hypothetical protein
VRTGLDLAASLDFRGVVPRGQLHYARAVGASFPLDGLARLLEIERAAREIMRAPNDFLREREIDKLCAIVREEGPLQTTPGGLDSERSHYDVAH